MKASATVTRPGSTVAQDCGADGFRRAARRAGKPEFEVPLHVRPLAGDDTVAYGIPYGVASAASLFTRLRCQGRQRTESPASRCGEGFEHDRKQLHAENLRRVTTDVGEDDIFVDGDDYDAFFTRTIGNFWPYAPTIFDYVRRAMPADQPGTLRDDEVYALMAWLLWKNDIIAEDVRLDRPDATARPHAGPRPFRAR